MAALSREQIERYREDGVLLVEDAVDSALLARLQADFASWIEESRGHDAPYGEAIDGRPRFDLEPGHSAEHPALRRVNAPLEVSEAVYEAVTDSAMVDWAAQLAGPDLRYHHSKINSKLPGAATAVKWHQDFTYTPHSNSDLVTALLMLDEVTEENGPLRVLPGSHKGPLLSLWHDGRFTGAIDPALEQDYEARAVSCIGPAGAVCFMHTRLAHGSAANLSQASRTLLIAVYAAADAVACSPNPVPSRFDGLLVRGSEPNRIRCTEYEVEIPAYPKAASFFHQQAGGD